MVLTRNGKRVSYLCKNLLREFMINIAAIEYYLPENILTNEDISKEFPEWSAEKIKAKIGVEARHVAKESETALDLAYEASLKLLLFANSSCAYLFTLFAVESMCKRL
ncbi:MAG: hypothetical protein DI529_15675 [Chryseobacterium sp.]|nr:MAG: hypothetical protein DI529_15675 [Chryseobacterium sp.]